MSTFLKTFFYLSIIFTCLLSHDLLAQCNIKKTTKNSITTAETAERYQYLRTEKQYYGLLIKTVLVKKYQSKTYTIIVKYTGGASGVPTNLNFKLKDDNTLIANLKYVKSQKVDDVKTSTKIYEVTLPDIDLSKLKQTPLKEIQIVLNKTLNPVIIPVDDETFIQNQLSCLQSLELN